MYKFIIERPEQRNMRHAFLSSGLESEADWKVWQAAWKASATTDGWWFRDGDPTRNHTKPDPTGELQTIDRMLTTQSCGSTAYRVSVELAGMSITLRPKKG